VAVPVATYLATNSKLAAPLINVLVADLLSKGINVEEFDS